MKLNEDAKNDIKVVVGFLTLFLLPCSILYFIDASRHGDNEKKEVVDSAKIIKEKQRLDSIKQAEIMAKEIKAISDQILSEWTDSMCRTNEMFARGYDRGYEDGYKDGNEDGFIEGTQTD